ncbi:hypothetical protein CMQ_4984 [Grosmannia clavigera kw1407]|uniref:Uncharacterized protein n=1 Tax=Grosmannia clavigera (strain kw1407 / UAMH 11150) TaxID=655863 RepID=F0XKC1_GROCL|nr:uncharacterized protein CMQ_4984 [Grosmannia clavigera kw1407]EFX01913.1 hypothetical protein CMQ_4984 [Grosmannia clavigera kw1407]
MGEKVAPMVAENQQKKMGHLQPGVIARRRPIIGRGHPASAFGKPLGVIYVSRQAAFMSLVNRAIKLLDEGPGGAKWSATRVLPLNERAKANRQAITGPPASAKRSDLRAVRQREVHLLATGHAISKLTLVAAWFQRQQGYVVEVRTRWSATVDDLLIPVGGDSSDGSGKGETGGLEHPQSDEQDREQDKTGDTASQWPRHETRLRNVSCLEVAIRLA